MKKSLAVLLTLTLLTVGCSATWLSTFSGYVKIAGPILIQILDIVALAKGQPINASLQAKITADQNALNTLASSVSSASAANLLSTCANFNLAVATFAGDLTAIEQIANTGVTVSGEIGAAVGIAQAAISEIEVPITACQNAPTPAAARMHLTLAALTVTSPSDVVKRFNAVVDSKHRVHLHSAPVRVLTFGKLQ